MTWLREGDWRLRVGLGIVAAAVVVAGVIWLVVPRAGPGPAPVVAAPSPPHTPILVSVSAPRTTAAVGVPLQVRAHAVGTEPIGAIELWAGAERVETWAASDEGTSQHASWSWMPSEPGPALLLARAIDVRGRVAQSNVLRLDVAAAGPGTAWHSGITLAVAPGPPELALAVPAVQLEVAGCSASVSVSDVDPAAIGVGLYDLAPSSLTFEPMLTLPAVQSPPVVPLSSGLHLFTASVYADEAEVYSNPVQIDIPPGCDEGTWSGPVRLHDGALILPQDVDRAYAYLTRDGGTAVRLPADPGEFMEPLGGVYDASPHLPSLDADTLSVEAWGWKGGDLVSLGTGTWTAPEGGSSGSSGGSFATAPGTLGPNTSLYEVHDILLGSEFHCGQQFCFEEQLFTEIEVTRPPAGTFKPVNHTFRWQTQASGVDEAVWQVFFHPPPGTADLDPPFLLDQGPVPLDDADPGDFVIDLMPYLTGVVPINVGPADQAKGAQEQLKTILDPSLVLGGPTTDAAAVNLAWLPPGQIGYGTGGGNEVTDATFNVPDGALMPGDLWVRVVPIAGSAPVAPSNAVHVNIDEFVPHAINPSGPDYSDRYQLSIEHTPPVAPNDDYARCAVIAEVTDEFNDSNPLNVVWLAAIQKGHICYDPPDDDGWSPLDVFEAFVEWVSDAWDFVSGAWDDIKGFVVDFVLTAVPCDEFADADTCETIAGYALDAALVAVGVPPSIPDFDTTIGAFKGEIGEAMIEMAGLEGACDAAATAKAAPGGGGLPTCDDIIDAAMTELVAQVEAQQHNAAENAIDRSAPKGIVLEPHPDGLWKPPSITVTATRISEEPVPVACYVSASMTSKLTNHTWMEMDQVKEGTSVNWVWKESQVSGDVSGSPLSGPGFTLPDLALHESHTQTIWLSNELDWWESLKAKHWEVWQQGGHPYIDTPDVLNHAYRLLQAGAELTFGASSNCAQSVQQVGTLAASGSNL